MSSTKNGHKRSQKVIVIIELEVNKNDYLKKITENIHSETI